MNGTSHHFIGTPQEQDGVQHVESHRNQCEAAGGRTLPNDCAGLRWQTGPRVGFDGSRPPLFLLSRYPRPRLGRSRLARDMGD
jgi:hypothetical protein